MTPNDKTPAVTGACENETCQSQNTNKPPQNQTVIERLEGVRAALDRFLERNNAKVNR